MTSGLHYGEHVKPKGYSNCQMNKTAKVKEAFQRAPPVVKSKSGLLKAFRLFLNER